MPENAFFSFDNWLDNQPIGQPVVSCKRGIMKHIIKYLRRRKIENSVQKVSFDKCLAYNQVYELQYEKAIITPDRTDKMCIRYDQ